VADHKQVIQGTQHYHNAWGSCLPYFLDTISWNVVVLHTHIILRNLPSDWSAKPDFSLTKCKGKLTTPQKIQVDPMCEARGSNLAIFINMGLIFFPAATIQVLQLACMEYLHQMLVYLVAPSTVILATMDLEQGVGSSHVAVQL
jgi:hypothetical protein